jgi:hypothetical protein
MNWADLRSLIATANKGSTGFVKVTAPLDISFLGSADYTIAFESGRGLEPDQIAAAVVNLCKHTAQHRAQIGEALYAACLKSFEDCSADFPTPQHHLDFEKENTGWFPDATVPRTPDDVWALVSTPQLRVTIGPSWRVNVPGPLVVLSFRTAWDGEHGVALFFADGKDLVHVGDEND